MAFSNPRFGRYVRAERLKNGIGLRQLSRCTGISPGYLSRMERGKIAPPREENIRAIAAALGCGPEKLIRLSGRIPAAMQKAIQRCPDEVIKLIDGVLRLPKKKLKIVNDLIEKSKSSG